MADRLPGASELAIEPLHTTCLQTLVPAPQKLPLADALTSALYVSSFLISCFLVFDLSKPVTVL